MNRGKEDDLRLAAAQLHAALRPVPMPDGPRAALRAQILRQASLGLGQTADTGPPARPVTPSGWRSLAVAACLTLALSGLSGYAAFHPLSRRAVAADWERQIVQRTQELARQPAWLEQDPVNLARSVGARQVEFVDPGTLPLAPHELLSLRQGRPVQTRGGNQVLVPLGDRVVLAVVPPPPEAHQLAGELRQIYAISAAVGSLPVLLALALLAWASRRPAPKEEVDSL